MPLHSDMRSVRDQAPVVIEADPLEWWEDSPISVAHREIVLQNRTPLPSRKIHRCRQFEFAMACEDAWPVGSHHNVCLL